MKASHFSSLVAVVSLFVFTGCGDDSTPGGTPDAAIGVDAAGSNVLANCESFCDNQGTATNCPPEVATDGVVQCKQFCSAVIQSLDTACTVIADAFYTCSSANDTWECGPGGNLPLEIDDFCMTESEAYATCLASQ